MMSFDQYKILNERVNESATEFDKKLRKMFPTIKPDYLGHGNMVDVEDYLKYDYASLGGGDVSLNNIIKDLKDGGVSLKDIKIGDLVHSKWGWAPEDLDSELHAGTLWIDTDDDKIIQRIIKKYDPDEHRLDKRVGKYRLWWD